MSSWNDNVIAEFRANNGSVGRFGTALLLLHTIGAKTGQERIIPVRGEEHGDGWILMASAAGSPKHPAWYFNLKAHPDIDVEVALDGEIRTVPATLTELEGDEYATEYAAFVARNPGFQEYEAKTQGRQMPLFKASRR